MRILVDANRFVDYSRADEDTRAMFDQAARIFFPFIVVGEIRAGTSITKHGREQQQILAELLARHDVAVIHSSDNTIRRYAEIYQQLVVRGTLIPTNDIWIAALALEHDLHLYTRDQHFRHIPALKLL
ncbi:MAG: PIN domain-containing protein [Verrucomicrobiales bacterium]|jgi:predicted nucleic acid-binding protein|nr:PIN domain-containing protein [Verrucomicrobiales bacterium]